MKKSLVGVIMGSKSDWNVVRYTSETLDQLGIPHETRAISAHRTPDSVQEFCSTARDRGLEVIIAAAGGAAHLAGVAAAYTTLPILAIPIESKLSGLDSLLSMVQMPAGIPVGTLAIGKAGAINAALFAAAILSNKYPPYKEALDRFRAEQRDKILSQPDPRLD